VKIDEQRHGDVTVVGPQGPLTGADTDQFQAHMVKLLNERSAMIVLDASKIPFVDSRALEVLVDVTEQLIRSGRALKLVGVNSTLREVLEVTELASLFEQFDDVGAAVGSLR